MSTSVKIARLYLYVVNIYYILIGIAAVTNFSHLSNFTYFLTPFGVFGTAIGAVPERLVTKMVSFAPPTTEVQILLVGAGVIAITLAIVGFISLHKIKSSPRWIFLWYSLIGLAFIISSDNIVVLLSPYTPFYVPFLEFAHPVLLFTTTIFIHRGVKQEPSNPVS